MRLILALIGIVAFVAFDVLGFFVRGHDEPAAFAILQQTLLNHGTLIAWWCTWLGYAYVLVPLCVLTLVIAWRAPIWRARALIAVGSLLISWQGADLFQKLFERPRPIDWVVKHETAFSYPSSHAAIAFGFYLLWALWLLGSDLPPVPRRLGALGLLVAALAICWSRLALGAHHTTDILGGALLGTGVAAIIMALVPINVLAKTAGRA